MLYRWWQHGDLGEYSLVCGTGQDAILVPLRPQIRPYHDDRWPQILDKMPSRPCNSEEIQIVVDVAEDLDGSVVLEQQVHLNGYPPDVLENGRLLHIRGIRAEAIKTVSS